MSDADEYGDVVDALVGKVCQRTLATNSVKLRVETADDSRGRQYIWIDPPWVFQLNGQEVTTSREYRDENFEEWSKLFDPLNQTAFTGWETDTSGSTTFQFENGYTIVLPAAAGKRRRDDWYLHWYASEAT